MDPSTHDLARTSLLFVAGAAGIGWVVAMREKARTALTVAPFVIGALFAIAYWLGGVWARDVIVVDESAGTVTATRMIVPFGYDDPAGSTRVINHTSRALRVNKVFYATFSGYGAAADDRGEVVMPGTERVCEHAIEYLGPDAHPPDQITSETPMDARYQLTW